MSGPTLFQLYKICKIKYKFITKYVFPLDKLVSYKIDWHILNKDQYPAIDVDPGLAVILLGIHILLRHPDQIARGFIESLKPSQHNQMFELFDNIFRNSIMLRLLKKQTFLLRVPQPTSGSPSFSNAFCQSENLNLTR